MATFAEIKSKLADWLGNASTTRLSDSIRGDLVNSAIRELVADNDFNFGEGSSPITTVAGTTSYAAPTGFLRPLVLHYSTAANDYIEVEQLEGSYPEWLRKYQGSDETGEPAEYAIWNGSIYIGPKPDAVYSVNVVGFYLPTELSADADTNDFTANAWQLILFTALADASPYLLDDSRLAYFERKRDFWKGVIRREHDAAQNSGRSVGLRIPG